MLNLDVVVLRDGEGTQYRCIPMRSSGSSLYDGVVELEQKWHAKQLSRQDLHALVDEVGDRDIEIH